MAKLWAFHFSNFDKFLSYYHITTFAPFICVVVKITTYGRSRRLANLTDNRGSRFDLIQLILLVHLANMMISMIIILAAKLKLDSRGKKYVAEKEVML